MICIPGATLPEWFFVGARICQPLPRLQSWREGRRGTICLQQTISSDVQYYCHKTQNLNQIMPISTEECNGLSSALFQLLSEEGLQVIFMSKDTRFQGLQSSIFSFSLKKGFELSERLCDVRLSMPQLQEAAGSVIMFLTILIMISNLRWLSQEISWNHMESEFYF